MSVALSKVRADVQMTLGDNDDTRAWYSPFFYDQTIVRTLIKHWAKSAMVELYVANAFSILADGSFELPTSRQYTGAITIQDAGTGLFLRKAGRDEMDSLRSGIILPSVSGIPSAWAIYEQRDSKIEGWAWPPPGASRLCHLRFGIAPEDIRSASMDTVTVDMSTTGIESLVLDCAFQLAARATPAKLDERGLSRDILSEWKNDSRVLRYKDNARRHNQRAVGRIKRVVA